MRRAALVLAALIMCAVLASFASCKGTSRAGNTAAPIEATNGDTENTAIKPYNRLMLTRYEEIVDDESIMLCPYVDDEEYGYISTLIAIRIRARIRSYDMPVSTSFRIKSNACGVLSMIIEFLICKRTSLWAGCRLHMTLHWAGRYRYRIASIKKAMRGAPLSLI